jgi:hypothetical protein
MLRLSVHVLPLRMSVTLTVALPRRTVRGTRTLRTRDPGMRWVRADEASVRPLRRRRAIPSVWRVTLNVTLTTRTPFTRTTATRVIEAGAASAATAAVAVVEALAPAGAARSRATTARMGSVRRIHERW